MSHLCECSIPAVRLTLRRVKGLVIVPRILFAGLVVTVCGALPAVADVPISTTRPEARQIVLDHDPDTENYFALVLENPEPAWWNLDLYLSTNEGASWTRNPVLGSGADLIADMAAAGGHVYVGYSVVGYGLELWLDSFSTADGSYAFTKAVLDVSPAKVADIALASDQDGADSEIYVAFISDNGELRLFFGSSADETTLTELSPSISNADSGLDMTFNANSLDHDVFISYVGTDGKIHVWRSYPWEEVAAFPYSGADGRTAVSASDDNVVVAYQGIFAYGGGVIAQTSDDAGDTWDLTYLDAPQFSGDGQFSMVDVTARGSQGFAAVYHQGVGVFDPIFIRRGIDFHPASWEPRVQINQFDAWTAWPVTINWFPPHHYGIAYVAGTSGLPFFDLVDASLFSDGFESGATSAWSATVP